MSGRHVHFLWFFHSLPLQFPSKPIVAVATTGQVLKLQGRELFSLTRGSGLQSMGETTLLPPVLYSLFAWSEAVAIMQSVGYGRGIKALAF